MDEFRLGRTEGDVQYYRNVGEHLERSPEREDSDDLIIDSNHASLSLLNIDLSVDLPGTASEALEREWNQLAFGRPPLDDPGA